VTTASPRQRVLLALDALVPYLHGFVNQAFDAASYRGKRVSADIGPLAHAIKDEWRGVFAARLDGPARNYVHELLDIRNRLSHSEPFDAEQARRACDTIRLVAQAIGAPLAEFDARAVVAGFPVTGAQVAGVGAQPGASPAVSGSETRSGRRPSQRDVMRAIWVRCAPDEDRAISEYAAAERRGEAMRKQNASGMDPETYARALLADGQKKGWL
jgi:hypothetical protein